MGFLDERKALVRVGVNELQPRDRNPNVPFTAEEIAADCVAVARRGATMVHLHSRHADGSQALSDDAAGASVYRRIWELTAAASEIVLEPTNMPLGHDPSTMLDTPHFWFMHDELPSHAPLEIVNIDAFRFAHHRVAWDQQFGLRPVDGRRIVPDGTVELPEVIRETLLRKLVPFFGVFELSDIRLLGHWARLGLLPTPVLVQINFFGDLMKGPTPGLAALDAYLVEWPSDVDAEICVFARMMPDVASYESFFDGALDRGVHVRCGLGDNPHLWPDATNADVVEHTRSRLERRGLLRQHRTSCAAESGCHNEGQSPMTSRLVERSPAGPLRRSWRGSWRWPRIPPGGS